jgi:biotin carboxylase
VVDSVLYPGTSSFLRYQYPSSVPPEVAERLIDVSGRVALQMGLDHSTFNIEYFWDPERDRLDIVEVNPRLSQSHAPLFEYVDGLPNHHCMVALGLGRDPRLPYREGPYRIAGKWFWRRFSDAYVRSTPGPDDIARVEREVPGAIIDVVAQEGERLSGLPMQDSYSFELAALYIGADDEHELEEKYRRCVELLPFGLDDQESE